MQISLPIPGATDDRISVFDAIDKQLGLKLEPDRSHAGHRGG